MVVPIIRNEGHLKAIVRLILYELAEADESTFLE
jgi:hypothetical protein